MKHIKKMPRVELEAKLRVDAALAGGQAMTPCSPRIPPLIRCPYCSPGTVSYAGKVINIICAACKAEIEEASKR